MHREWHSGAEHNGYSVAPRKPVGPAMAPIDLERMRVCPPYRRRPVSQGGLEGTRGNSYPTALDALPRPHPNAVHSLRDRC